MDNEWCWDHQNLLLIALPIALKGSMYMSSWWNTSSEERWWARKECHRVVHIYVLIVQLGNNKDSSSISGLICNNIKQAFRNEPQWLDNPWSILKSGLHTICDFVFPFLANQMLYLYGLYRNNNSCICQNTKKFTVGEYPLDQPPAFEEP